MQLTADNYLTVSKRAVLLPYTPRKLIPYEEMTENEVFNYSDDLIFDSECYSNYFLAAFRAPNTGRIIKFVPPFDPRKLAYVLQRNRLISFNSIKYDLPLLWAAYKNQDTQWLKKVSNDLVYGTWYQEVCKEHDIQLFSTNNIDLIEVCPLRGSLKLYGARLHSKRIQDLPFEHTTILNEKQKEIVADYCINNDLPATELLFNNLQEQIKLREDLGKEYKIDLRSKSDAQIAEAVIGTELKKIIGKWPSKPKITSQFKFFYQVPFFINFKTVSLNSLLNKIKKLQYSVMDTGRLLYDKELSINIGDNVYRLGSGGLHSSENECCVISDNEFEIVDRDVASYYPSIVLNLSLFPEHLGPNFLVVYRSLVERRLLAKKIKNLSISECLKITINGTFGKTGSPYSILYAPQMMIQITVTGQLALLMLIESLELEEIPVYSANTDGIVIKCPRTKKELMLSIIKKWEKQTGFETEETTYKAVYSRDVNAYVAVKDKEIKGKNVYYDPWRAKTAKDKYWTFQKNPNAQICVEAIEKLLLEGKPPEDTINECQDITKFVSVKNVKSPGAHKNGHYLGKVIRWYMALNEYGTINYIESGNKVADTEGAKPLMDMDGMPEDLNRQWYISKTKDMLYEMSYLKRPTQIKFF